MVASKHQSSHGLNQIVILRVMPSNQGLSAVKIGPQSNCLRNRWPLKIPRQVQSHLIVSAILSAMVTL